METATETRAWCVGLEEVANCANCYRNLCPIRNTNPNPGVSIQSTMLESYGSRGRRRGSTKGDS